MLIRDTDKTEAVNVYEDFYEDKGFSWNLQNIAIMEIT